LKIITRYILGEIFICFLVCLLAFTGILLTVQMLRLANLIINKGVEFTQILTVFISIIPTFLEIAIPLATLLGVMLAFARLSGDSEIVVIRASGISIKQLIKPVFAFGVGVGILSLLVSLHLRPWGFQNLSNTLFEIARTRSTAGLDEVVFNKLGHLTLYAEEIDNQSGELKRVLIDDKRGESRSVITGATGRIVSSARDQTITLHLDNGDIHEIVDGKYVLTNFTRNSLVMDSNEIFDPEAGAQVKRYKEMATAELREEIALGRGILRGDIVKPEHLIDESTKKIEPFATLMEDKFAQAEGETERPHELFSMSERDLLHRVSRMRTELGMRYSMPFASFILALVAMPLGVQPPRTQKTWGTGVSAVLGMGVFILYYGTLSVGVALAESGSLNSYIALWTPNLLAALLAVFMLKQVGSEKWQSIIDGIDLMLQYVARKLNRTKVRES